MDVTFVLEESGVSATVEVPCEVDAAAAKEVACKVLAVSPASVEMRIGTQVLEGTCRLQDTAFEAGAQVVLAFRCAVIRCPHEYKINEEVGRLQVKKLSLSRCGKLCVYVCSRSPCTFIGGFDTETFTPLFFSKVNPHVQPQAISISPCKTRCYLACGDHFREVALPGGELLRKVDGNSMSVFTCGGVIVSQGRDGASVYDDDLTLLRSLSHKGCKAVAVSHYGGWALTSSIEENHTRVWDVSTGVNVACAAVAGCVAVSQSAFAVGESTGTVHLYDMSGARLGSDDLGEEWKILGIQFTPCGKYFVVHVYSDGLRTQGYPAYQLHQYDATSMWCVHAIPSDSAFAISPCSRVVVSSPLITDIIKTRHLHPHNSD